MTNGQEHNSQQKLKQLEEYNDRLEEENKNLRKQLKYYEWKYKNNETTDISEDVSLNDVLQNSDLIYKLKKQIRMNEMLKHSSI